MSTEDDPVDAAADATTADDDEGEIGERNVGGTHISQPGTADATTADDDEGEIGERNVGGTH